MESTPPTRGKSVIKSMEIQYQGQGRVGNDANNPAGFLHSSFVHAHISHHSTYELQLHQ